MDVIKLKKCKSIDIDSKLKDYIIKNGDKNTASDVLKAYFGEIAQNREVMAKMDETKKNPEQIKSNMRIITSYINQMNLMRKKMIFGKEKFCCKIEFNWTDTVKSSHCKCYNIEFEICNAMFNLATLYYYEGINIANTPSATKDIRKEATKQFKYAMYLYNWIIEEAGKIPDKERPVDLQENYLNFCIKLCEINGQLEIYRISKETNPKEFILHAKLLMGLSDLYRKITGLGATIKAKKSLADQLNYYQNRSIYYKGKMFYELKNEGKRKFDDRGVGYGEVVYFLNLTLNELSQCEKTIKKISKILKVEEFEAEYQKIGEEKKEAEDLNNRIYHEALPKEESIKYESKIMISKSLPDELYIDKNESKAKEDEKIYCPDLDLMAPKEITDMLGRYKPKINELITSNLDKNENEGTIANFIKELDLPKYLTKKDGEEELEDEDKRTIPEELWQKIEKVQQIGGINGLKQIMQGIMGKSNFLINNLENLLHSFEAEDKDDRICRQRYRDKWIREPSLKLNYQMVQAAQQYIKVIRQTQAFDQQASNEISNDSGYFEKLMLPLEQLNNNIPVNKETKTELNKEEKEVKDEIAKLYELSDKCTSIIKPIFSQINDDSVAIGLFLDVLNRKTTEQSIYDKAKTEFELKFGELEKISEAVKKQKEVITELVKKNHDKVIPKVNEDEENRIIGYFRNLNELTDLFMSKHEKILKGDNYYNGLKEKIDKLIKFGNDWMIKRSDEKNAIIRSTGSLYNSQMYGGNTGFGGPGH